MEISTLEAGERVDKLSKNAVVETNMSTGLWQNPRRIQNFSTGSKRIVDFKRA
jgi:hypothetical protein